MKKLFFVILTAVLIQSPLFAQDTTWVQTLEFDSITTRRGVWQFPENTEWQKVLMYYTLKCDYATQHDQYSCGEWDYLTYSQVWEHTGLYDSTAFYQPSLTYVSRKSIGVLPVTTEPTFYYTAQEIVQVEPVGDTSLFEVVEIGGASTSSSIPLNLSAEQVRSLFLWHSDEISSLPNSINTLQLNFQGEPSEIKYLTIKMMMTDSVDISSDFPLFGLQEVYHQPFTFTEDGWHSFDLSNSFDYDGASNLLLEISVEAEPGNQAIEIVGEPVGNGFSIACDKSDHALDLRGVSDFVDVPDGVYFDGDFTISYWLKKRSNRNWSRVIDFGNGSGSDNVLLAMTNGSGGKMAFSVRQGTSAQTFTTDDVFPLNEWVQVTLRLTAHLGWLYINGEFYQLGLLQQPLDVERTTNYIGRSNWSNDMYGDALVDDIRIWSSDIGEEAIANLVYNSLDNPVSDPELELYYDFENDNGNIVTDASAHQRDGFAYGLPRHTRVVAEELKMDYEDLSFRPQVRFGNLETTGGFLTTTDVVLDSLPETATQIMVFESSSTTTVPVDTVLYYVAGYSYVMQDGAVVDSVFIVPEETLVSEDILYYGTPFEVIEPWEIGRFITPYGINLDLGPEGFTWVYDVSDYAPILNGDVDFSAGNQQELIDIRFAFIAGVPAREVLQITRPWGKFSSRSYTALSDDLKLSATDISLTSQTEQVKLKARLTGHGHNSNSGNYPHCCEWKDNTHYIMSGGDTIDDWHIWQTHDCALNPVYPQGGTWPGAREGWCPGDRVDEHEVEMTPFIQDGVLNLDYGITPVPANNLGMGNGNYVVGMHLIEYGANNFELDAELLGVISPNNERYFSRQNPVCSNPKIVIRNNGSQTLTSATINFGIEQFDDYSFEWTGSLSAHQTDTIELTALGSGFWLCQDSKHFYVEITNPNGGIDGNLGNNSYRTSFDMPALINTNTFVMTLKMNNQPSRYTLWVTDESNQTLFLRDNMSANETYYDTLNLVDGCYTLHMLDTEDMGLSYWAYPEQGYGSLRLLDLEENYLKSFNSEFGREIKWAFTVGEHLFVAENNLGLDVTLSPNPASSELCISFEKPVVERGNIALIDMGGVVVYSACISASEVSHQLDVSDFPSGLYVAKVVIDHKIITKKVVIQ